MRIISSVRFVKKHYLMCLKHKFAGSDKENNASWWRCWKDSIGCACFSLWVALNLINYVVKFKLLFVGFVYITIEFITAKALELFLQDLCDRTYEITLQRGAKTMNSLHLWVYHAMYYFSMISRFSESDLTQEIRVMSL